METLRDKKSLKAEIKANIALAEDLRNDLKKTYREADRMTLLRAASKADSHVMALKEELAQRKATKAASKAASKAANASKAASKADSKTGSRAETYRVSSLSETVASLPNSKGTKRKSKSLGQRFKSWFTRKNKRALSGIVEEGPTYKYNNPLRREHAAKTLQSFYKAHSRRSRAIYLNRFCKNPGVCMALGIHAEEIKKHFGGFTDFKYAQPPLLLIGAPSANGFINEIKYVNDKTITNLRNTRRIGTIATAKAKATLKALSPPASPYRTADYVAYAVLKTPQDKSKDSPLYEYLVGQFINKVNSHYPCFIETYGYYIYKTQAYDIFKNKRILGTKDNSELNKIMEKLKNDLALQPPIKDQPSLKNAIDDSCHPNNTLAILIQHLKNVQTFRDFMNSLPTDTLNPDDLYEQSEIIFLLYQIYFPLAQLSTKFTHNDLHTSNVLLYQPDDDVKYIEYHYHTSAGVVVKFKSRFMAKIIDYGRAFYHDNDILNSLKVYDEVCESKKCTPRPSYIAGNPNDKVCGRETGFKYYLSYGRNNVTSQYKSSRYSNMSSDLRLLNIFTDVKYLKKFSKTEMTDLTDLFHQVEYDDENGAKEVTGVNTTPGFIKNVIDAEIELRILALNPKYIELNNDMYYDYEQLGELHIYSDGRKMKYIETSSSDA